MPNSAGSPRSPLQLDLDGRCQLAQTLLRRGARQIAVLRATSAGIARAPSIDERAGSLERAREELLQLERSAELYAEATGGDLLADAEQMVGDAPTPESWVDAALAQLFLCLATQVELGSSTEPNAREALARTCEQVNAARAALHEAGAFAEQQRDALRTSGTRWLNMALRTLESDEARTQFTRALEQAVEPHGLRMPGLAH